MTNPIIQELEKSQVRKNVTEFNVGDTVEVRMRLRESEQDRKAKGKSKDKNKEADKERFSLFIGTVIGRQGSGMRETFTVRRLVQGEGVERIFPLHSPLLMSVIVRHKGEVRRAKLYYLRDRVGKATRIKGRTVHEVVSDGSPAPETAQPTAEAPAKE